MADETLKPYRQMLEGPFADALPEIVRLGEVHQLREGTCLSVLLQAQRVARDRAKGVEKEPDPNSDSLASLAAAVLSYVVKDETDGQFPTMLKRILLRVQYLVQFCEPDPSAPHSRERFAAAIGADLSKLPDGPVDPGRLSVHASLIMVAIEYMDRRLRDQGARPAPSN